MANLDPLRIPASYWDQCIADELALAPLMGYSDLRAPTVRDQGAWIFGHSAYTFRSAVGPATEPTHAGPLPRWRRDAHATGGLLERVPADVTWCWDSVRLSIQDPKLAAADMADAFSAVEFFRDHPSNGHALRKALVNLALDYLGECRLYADAARRGGSTR
jgi:hypothetical protein